MAANFHDLLEGRPVLPGDVRLPDGAREVYVLRQVEGLSTAEVAETLGVPYAHIALAAAIVVITGCLGAICGPEFCRLIGLKGPAAVGLAVGTASHGIGTARMLEVDRLGGAVAGLAIGLNGLFTAFLVPLLFVLFHL